MPGSKHIGILRHLLLILTIAILVSGMIYKNSDSYNYEYGFLYQFTCTSVLFIAVIYLNLYLLVPQFLLKGRLTLYSFLVVLSVLFTLLGFVVVQNLFTCSSDNRELPEIGVNITGTFISLTLIIAATSVYPLFHNWIKHIRQINELKSSTIETELQQLKNQINPHFLFNTINNANIKTEKDPEEAYRIIAKLEDLLRYQLTETPNEKICLKNDIIFLSDYLELERTRRNQFFYTLQAGNDVDECYVFPLLFIPFVENAVKHSHTATERAEVHITFAKEKGSLHFCCENTKPKVSVKQNTGGLGLKNIKRRLELLYGNAYTLSITESNEKYTVNLYLKT